MIQSVLPHFSAVTLNRRQFLVNSAMAGLQSVSPCPLIESISFQQKGQTMMLDVMVDRKKNTLKLGQRLADSSTYNFMGSFQEYKKQFTPRGLPNYLNNPDLIWIEGLDQRILSVDGRGDALFMAKRHPKTNAFQRLYYIDFANQEAVCFTPQTLPDLRAFGDEAILIRSDREINTLQDPKKYYNLVLGSHAGPHIEALDKRR